MMDLYHVKLTFVCSLFAFPVTYMFNNVVVHFDQNIRPFWMMALAFILLTLVGYVAHKLSKVKDWLFTGIVIFAFSAVVDLIITLEFHGIITNFMSEYLKYGEPYLFCTWGTAITLFDAIGFFTMHHLIVYFLTNGLSWRSTGIYYGAGILNSMIVLLLGALVGSHTPTFCIFINVPFVIFPILILVRAFGTETCSGWTNRCPRKFILVDLILAVGFLASIWVTIAKGLGAFGYKGWAVWKTIDAEPSLLYKDPSPFAELQAIVFLFYLLPLQFLSLVYIFKTDKPQFLWDSTIIHAGAILQGQFAFMFQCLSSKTPSEFRSEWNNPKLWAVNLVLVIVPHLFLLRLRYHKHSGKFSRSPTKLL